MEQNNNGLMTTSSLQPDDNEVGNSFSLFKNVGMPVIATFAMYLAYKRFFHVPNPQNTLMIQRTHLIKSNIFRVVLTFFRSSNPGFAFRLEEKPPLIQGFKLQHPGRLLFSILHVQVCETWLPQF